jgi:hypothetical protein
MSKVQYKHLDLDGASLIQRRHKRQVVPPGMWAVNNFLQSPSDNSLTLRPDFVLGNRNVKGMSGDLVLQTTNKFPDLLNSISGVYGSSDLVYFTSYIPWGVDKTTGIDAILSDSFSTGTCTAVAGSFAVTFAAVAGGSANIDFREIFWRGCILKIEFTAGDEYYLIDKIPTADEAAETATVYTTMPVETSEAAVSYAIYYNHNPWRAASNKLQLDQFGGAIIYCSPDISTSVAAVNVCGPFYSNVTENDWSYGYTKREDYTYTQNNPSEDAKLSLATNGTNWIFAEGSGSTVLKKTLDITANDTWTEVEFADLTVTVPQPNADDVAGDITGILPQLHQTQPGLVGPDRYVALQPVLTVVLHGQSKQILPIMARNVTLLHMMGLQLQ